MFSTSRLLRRSLYTSVSSYNTIVVDPIVSHISNKVTVTGTGFESNAPVTVQCTLKYPEERFDFKSYAHIYTDKDGCFDLKTNESYGGTYAGVEDMGLFWSMEKQGESPARAILMNGLRNFSYRFDVYNQHLSQMHQESSLCHAHIERYAARNVTRHEITDKPFKGTLFVPDGLSLKSPAIITLFGGVKRGRVFEHFAAFLAHHGFVTFSLAFFGVDG